jgi:biopolymer transport protein ExbD
MALSVAQRSKIRRLSQPKELSPDEEGGELNIVPFLDIVVNILIFVLATVAVTFTSTIETTPPAKGSGVRAAAQNESLNLTVLIVNDGFSLKATAGQVAPGCAGIGAGVSIPKKVNQYDFAGLTQCAARLKASNANYADETQVGISANNATEYQLIIQVIDALRKTPDGKQELFPDVNFKVAL